MIRDESSLEFCPDLSQRANRIESFQSREERNLKKRNESSKQHDGDHHASNQNMTILDEHKNLRGNLYWINDIANPGGKLHQETQLLALNFLSKLKMTLKLVGGVLF